MTRTAVRTSMALLACALVAACSGSKGEPVSDAEFASLREGMTYDEVVQAIGGEPHQANSGTLPDGEAVATYVSPRESGGRVQLMFRGGRVSHIVEEG